MPFVLGLVIIILAAALLWESWTAWNRAPQKKSSLWAGVHWRRILWVSLLLLGYSLLLPKIGYLAATFLLTVFLLRGVEPMKWASTLVIGVLTSVITYYVFGVWLSVPFPRGILNF